ncbi:hypothetical protein SAMN04488072_10497 [Lentibacillus halodurans]|uniref:5,10-methylene-tetrahydrofolate dehydrogenase n=1 Tax=Lentibacillus halodurans TaxID=237679 RepID=A0A1I0X1X3_9BACI|nr:hypothetical protein [Lentibacillus halodurans]SFA95012.1 hypothetical protein SAMN04488072_10497 [Lentibacillus halodurans]
MVNKLTVGLIPAPELPETVASKLMERLPEALSKNIDGDISWEVSVVRDPLTGAAENVDRLIKRAEAIKQAHQWHYTVCLTDLPVFSNKGVVLGDVNDEKGVAQISVPAFGLPPVQKRVKKAIIQMVGELYFRVNGKLIANGDNIVHNTGLLARRFFSPVRKITAPDDGIEKSDVRFILKPRTYGRFRLLLGMTHANRPWSIIPAFKRVMAIAFATGAYGLVFRTLWRLSASYESTRFVVLMLGAILGMVIWIIFAHNLWEKPSGKSQRKMRLLYNAATFLTLVVAVSVYYVMLFVLFLTAVAFIVPPELFSDVVGMEEDKVGFHHFMQLTWLVTSVATVAGAIGSGLENDKTVRNIMYGYRQQQRSEEMDYYGDDVED